jgi:hypothetical protein
MNINTMEHDLEYLFELSNKCSLLANELDFSRQIKGLDEEDKEEMWNMVLGLTEFAAALDRIKMLSE